MLRRLLVAVTLLFVTATPVATADPGVLLEQRPTTVFLGPFPAPVKAWHLLYRSTSATGKANAVSGTLLVPLTPWTQGPRPLITYAVGTHGLGDQCAPSQLLARGVEDESGVLADLNAVFRFNDGGPAFGLILGAATGFAAAYDDVPFESILNDRGRAAVAKVSEACTVELGAAAPFAHLQDFVTVPDPIHDPRWQARLAENYLGTTAPKAPVYLYHGTLDELIPFSVGAA